MSDSDSDSGGEADGGRGLDLTAVLFGNIDSAGQLETDVLDAEARAQLRGLSKLGLGQLLEDVVGEEATAGGTAAGQLWGSAETLLHFALFCLKVPGA